MQDKLIAIGILQRGSEELLRIARPVDLTTGEEAAELCEHLTKTLLAISQWYDFRHGMGLAAPQLGIRKQAFVVSTDAKLFRFCANPRILDTSDEYTLEYEGCLSFWNVRGRVLRPRSVEVEYYDENRRRVSHRATELEARLMMHEYDHLCGILYTARMPEGENLTDLATYRAVRRSEKS